MRAQRDLELFAYTLPYASELFGVYSPMIGWRSKRIVGRFKRGFASDIANLKYQVLANVRPRAEIEAQAVRPGRVVSGLLRIKRIEPADPPTRRARRR